MKHLGLASGLLLICKPPQRPGRRRCDRCFFPFLISTSFPTYIRTPTRHKNGRTSLVLLRCPRREPAPARRHSLRRKLTHPNSLSRRLSVLHRLTLAPRDRTRSSPTRASALFLRAPSVRASATEGRGEGADSSRSWRPRRLSRRQDILHWLWRDQKHRWHLRDVVSSLPRCLRSALIGSFAGPKSPGGCTLPRTRARPPASSPVSPDLLHYVLVSLTDRSAL